MTELEDRSKIDEDGVEWMPNGAPAMGWPEWMEFKAKQHPRYYELTGQTPPAPEQPTTAPRLTVVEQLDGTERDLTPYASKAVADELAKLAALARPWHAGARWDATCYEVACNLIELGNASWSGFSVPELESAFYQAAPRDHIWSTREHRAKWESARQTVGDTARPKPADTLTAPRVEEVSADALGGAQIGAESGSEPTTSAAADDQAPLLNPRLDWHELFASEDDEDEWIAYPLLPARGMVALYSAPKAGKSLLLLEMVVAISQGRAPFNYGNSLRPAKPYRVLYVDFENDPKRDIKKRLIAMGYGPDDLDNLVYLSYPTLAKLDNATGAADLVRHALHYGCDVIVIDTISRAVNGPENDNDTWLAFYRHTGLALKNAELSCIRLDHSGKDSERGMRGGSAKYGDADAVWRLSLLNDTTIQLLCTDHRMPLAETEVILTREVDPLTHRVAGNPQKVAAEARAARRDVLDGVKVRELADRMDALEIPLDMSSREVEKTLRKYGSGAGRTTVLEAIKLRRERPTEVKSYEL